MYTFLFCNYFPVLTDSKLRLFGEVIPIQKFGCGRKFTFDQNWDSRIKTLLLIASFRLPLVYLTSSKIVL